MNIKLATGFRIWVLVISAVLVIGGALLLLVDAQKEELSALKSGIAQLKEAHIPMRFKIENRGEGHIEVKIKLYDVDGNQIAAVTHAMAGESLFIDFVSIPVEDRYLAFPKAIFTEAVPSEKGLSLFPLYDKAGMPQVFSTQGMSEAFGDELTMLFSKLKQEQDISGAFGSAVHDIKELKTFDPGMIYRVVSRLKGGLEIEEDTQ